MWQRWQRTPPSPLTLRCCALCSDEDHGYNGVCSALVKTIATHLALMFALVMLSIHVSDLHANAKAKAFLVMVIVTVVTNTKTRIGKKHCQWHNRPQG